MQRPKILYILGQISYPLKVGQLVHTVDLLKFMSMYYDCYVIGFSANNNPDIPAEENLIKSEIPQLRYLKLFKKNTGPSLYFLKLINLILLKPIGFCNWKNSNFEKEIKKLIAIYNFDIIHLVWFPAVGQYLPTLKNLKTILSLQDSQSLLVKNETLVKNQNFFRIFSLKLAYKLYLRSERLLYKYASIIHTVSKIDKFYVDEFINSQNTVYIPTHIPADCKLYLKEIQSIKKRDFILLRPNGLGIEWFFEGTWPEIKSLLPKVTLTVIAQNLPLHVMQNIEADTQIIYKPWVQSLWEEILEHKIVLMTDMNGAGLPTRTICSMALGVPILGTPNSFRGMDVKNGITCVIASQKGCFANQAFKLYKNESLRFYIASNALKYAEINYSHEKVMETINALYQDIFKGVNIIDDWSENT
jgi:glycosyltransferase involved in cell wall biosynthesis